MKGRRTVGKSRPKPPIDAKGVSGLTDAMNALAATPGAAGPVQAPPGPPDAAAAPMPPAPMGPPVGATDGMGAGMGGMAIHPSAKGAKITGYEPRHTSKHR